MGSYKKNIRFILALTTIFLLLCGQVAAITANARISPLQGTSPLNVMFNDVSDGNPIEWHWDFGDGYTSDGPRTMHTYMVPGAYTVTLLVLDEQGMSDTAIFNKVITVSANPFMPVMPMNVPSFSADFTGGPQSGPAPLAVSFADLSKGNPKTWVWEFGDGTTSIDQNPVHIYSAPGTYTVTLKIAKDSSTGMKERKNYISVTNGIGITEQQVISSASVTPTNEKTPVLNTPVNETSEYTFMMDHITEETESCLSDLFLTTESETIQSDEDFSINVNGKPLEKVYFWISSEEVNQSDNSTYPVILDNEMVFDEQGGMYPIGSFIPNKKTGESIIDLIVNNGSEYTTRYYGLVALDKNGEHTISLQAKEASPGVYIANAVSGETGNDELCVNQLQVTILP
ncbi:PKD domain-containing protein [Methanospirillum sp.]